MIIWLASYPKSGNTWVRAIINSALTNNENINNQNMFSYFYQFIKKYIVITKDTNKIIDV